MAAKARWSVLMGVVVLLAFAGCASQEKAVQPTTTTTTTDAVKPKVEVVGKLGQPQPLAVTACKVAPKIDGVLSDACWNGAEVKGAWVDVYTGKKPLAPTQAYITYDSRCLYVVFNNFEPRMKDLVTDAGERDGNVWSDDSNELFLDPSGGKGEYYQIIVNSKGVLYDGYARDSGWDGKIKVATKKADKGWTVEMAIPLEAMRVKGSPRGQTWTANFCRNRLTGGDAEAFAWGDTGESFHNPDAFGKLLMK